MKVKEITPLQGKDGRDLWKVELEGTDKPLWLFNSPKFTKGDDVPEDSMETSRKGNSYVLKRKPKERLQGYSRNDDDIMLQVALKAVVELEKHHIVPAGDYGVGRIAQKTNELFASLIMMRPKKVKDASE